jgi:hypothetical protein
MREIEIEIESKWWPPRPPRRAYVVAGRWRGRLLRRCTVHAAFWTKIVVLLPTFRVLYSRVRHACQDHFTPHTEHTRLDIGVLDGARDSHPCTNQRKRLRCPWEQLSFIFLPLFFFFFCERDDILILRTYRKVQKQRKITRKPSGSRRRRRAGADDGAPLPKLPKHWIAGAHHTHLHGLFGVFAIFYQRKTYALYQQAPFP